MRMAAAMAACVVCSAASAAPPPLQELAGASRDAPPGPAFRQALAESRAAAVLPILFPAGSAQLTPSATRLLDGLDRQARGRLRIEGHAGRDRDLAARRAKAVAAYLAQNCGVDAGRLQTATAASPDDRRVLVVDLGP